MLLRSGKIKKKATPTESTNAYGGTRPLVWRKKIKKKHKKKRKLI